MKNEIVTKFIAAVKGNIDLKFKGTPEEGQEWMKNHSENVPHIVITDNSIQIIY